MTPKDDIEDLIKDLKQVRFDLYMYRQSQQLKASILCLNIAIFILESYKNRVNTTEFQPEKTKKNPPAT